MSSRVPVVNTTTSPSPQPSVQTPINTVSPPSMLPLYPSVDIDAHVRPSSLHVTWTKQSNNTNCCCGAFVDMIKLCIKLSIFVFKWHIEASSFFSPLRLRAIMTRHWPWPVQVAMKSLSQCSLLVGPTSSTGTRRVKGSLICCMTSYLYDKITEMLSVALHVCLQGSLP